MPAHPDLRRFCLPQWAYRTLVVCAPGRPLAPPPLRKAASPKRKAA
ncbi:MAG: hypothetical protein JNL41_03445 [Phenylobacterium sp.]|nr:hypothetical protein [Phenylobacterium sp.]MBL8553308.1 hypothetical protein [Phenylobacterium sp.]